MKTPFLKSIVSFFILFFCFMSLAARAEISAAALDLQQQWDKANFASADKKQKAAALKSLAETARSAATQNPADAEVQIWSGIVLSTYAGEAGMSALSLVKEAKGLFEKAIALKPDALQGAAYTSLGSLYYQVPGWPISFGDEDKAEELLKKGLALDPEGMDANYFYADYLLQQKHYAEAAPHFEKVLQASARPGREIADQGRKAQATDALARIHKKLD